MGKLTAFVSQDAGSDLAEYALLLAFVFIACVAMFIASGGDLSGIWSGLTNLVVNGLGVGVK